MTFATTDTFLAAFLRSAGFVNTGIEEGPRTRRYTFEDGEKIRWAVSEWKEWTGGRYRREYKAINGKAK